MSVAAAAAVIDTPVNRQMNDYSKKKLCNVATQANRMQIATCAQNVSVLADSELCYAYAKLIQCT